MSWKSTGLIEGVDRPLDAAFAAGRWLFRGLGLVYGCREDAEEPEWSTDLDPAEDIVSPKHLLATEAAAVTAESFSGQDRARIVALDPGTGEATWSRELEVAPTAFGLDLLDDRLLVHGFGSDGRSRLLQLRLQDGETLAQIETEAGNGVRAAAGRVFLPTRSALFVLEEPASPPRPALPVTGRIMAAAGDALYVQEFAAAPGAAAPAVVYVDGMAVAERGRSTDLPASQVLRRLVPLPQRGRVLAVAKESLRVIDFGGRPTVDLALPEGLVPTDAASTPHGIVVLAKSPQRKYTLSFHDPDTGARREEIPLRAASPSGVWHLGERLVAGGSDIEFFRWNGS